MNAVFAGIFRDLHERDVEDFGVETHVMWWPATRNGATYSVRVACVVGANRGDGKQRAGMLEEVTDSIPIHAARADFPFPPQPEDHFLLGPADGTGAAPDKAKCRSHRIVPGQFSDNPAHTHVRFTAEVA